MTTAPRTHTIVAPPVAAADGDAVCVAAIARTGGTVTGVTYTPAGDITGVATNNRRLRLVNKGADGDGTTIVAELQFTAGTDADGYTPTALTLSSTAANRDVAPGDVLAWESTHIGTGIADPGGLVSVGVNHP